MTPTLWGRPASGSTCSTPGETGYAVVTDPPQTDPQAQPLATDIEDDSAWYERALRTVQRSQQQPDRSVVVVRPDAPADEVLTADARAVSAQLGPTARDLIAVASRLPMRSAGRGLHRARLADGTPFPRSTTSHARG